MKKYLLSLEHKETKDVIYRFLENGQYVQWTRYTNIIAENKTTVSDLGSEQISSLVSMWALQKRLSTNKNSPKNRKQALKVTGHVQFCERKL